MNKTNIKKIHHVARREYVEAVKTRTFILSILITPLLIFGLGWVNSKMVNTMKTGTQPARRLAVIDQTGRLADDLAAGIRKHNASSPNRKLELVELAADTKKSSARIAPLQGEIRAGRLDGLLVIAPAAPLDPKSSSPSSSQSLSQSPSPRSQPTTHNTQPASSTNPQSLSQYYSKTKNITDLEFFSTVQRLLNEAVVAQRYRRNNLSPDLIARLNRPIPLEAVEVGAKTTTKGKTNELTVIMLPFFFMFLMFMGIMGTSQGMLTSVIEEKSSRVMEVLLAVVSPLELMAGKILGMTAVGLTMLAIWGAAAFGAAFRYNLLEHLRPAMLVCFLVYYVLGFCVIAALFAAIGSACNTLKEAQNLLGPVTMLIVLPMIVWMPIVNNPNSTMALVFSFFPTTASMIMVLRLSANPALPLVQILGSMAALVAWAVLIVWMAGKIFRTGILMYGKPPTLGELFRWLRAR